MSTTKVAMDNLAFEDTLYLVSAQSVNTYHGY